MNFEELKRHVTINSWTKNKEGVDAYGDMLSYEFEKLGLKSVRYPREKIGDHLHFVSAKKEGEKLLLLGHLDTVFPPGTFETWKEDDAWIYGPGVCDMKGGNWVALQALRRIFERFGEIVNIDMLLVSDEETGSDDSKHLTAELASDYDYCMVFEAAGVNDEVVIARKGVGTFFVDIEGIAAHAGNHYAKGADANLEAAIKLQKLAALTDLEKESTVNVGRIEGGIGANTVSPEAHLTFEIRYTQTAERDRLLTAIDTIVKTSYVKGTTSTLRGGIQRDVMEPTSAQQTFIEKIERVCGVTLSTEKRGGVSDANIVAASGVPTLDGWGPYGDGDHTVHERARKASFIKCIDLVEKIFAAFTERRFG